MKRIVIDLDYTLCTPLDDADQSLDKALKYRKAIPNRACIEQLRAYKAKGFEVTIHTSRNMRTYAGDVDAIKTHTLPIIIQWLEENDVPFDDVIVGKPWCGFEGFYVDDRAVRPSEFISLSEAEISDLLEREREPR